MIAYLEGLLAETWGTSCIVVTRGGVGYELDLPAHTMASLPGRGESVALYTSLVVREDAQQLFGFATFEERQVFEVLLTISKVGARTALAEAGIPSGASTDLVVCMLMCATDAARNGDARLATDLTVRAYGLVGAPAAEALIALIREGDAALERGRGDGGAA